MKRCAASLFILVMSSSVANGVIIDTIDANNRGNFRSDGRHSATNFTTITGLLDPNQYHSFFVFDLSGVSTPVLSGTLRLELENYSSGDASQTLDIFDVSTSATQLGTGFVAPPDNATGMAIHTDLGSGNTYGSASVTSSDVGSVIDISLNAQAVTDLNAAAGGPFSVGVQLGSPFTGTVDIIRFSNGAEARTHQLVLTLSDPPPVVLPEPATATACLLILLFGLRRTRRKRRG